MQTVDSWATEKQFHKNWTSIFEKKWKLHSQHFQNQTKISQQSPFKFFKCQLWWRWNSAMMQKSKPGSKRGVTEKWNFFPWEWGHSHFHLCSFPILPIPKLEFYSYSHGIPTVISSSTNVECMTSWTQNIAELGVSFNCAPVRQFLPTSTWRSISLDRRVILTDCVTKTAAARISFIRISI